jgi:phenylalanyl-tRNA synthetase beta chain
MKFSVNWLGEFVELPPSPEAMADLLTMSGIEIEAIEKRGADFDKIVVAQLTESKQHPNADRLTVCTVDDGSGKARQIVCGATNCKTGDKVPLALPGAELPGGLKIRASKLRGVESEGMLCSAKELGLGDDASGLLILSPQARIGARIGELFPTDTIFDVEITPNRGDLLSHFGLAREISALAGRPLQLPSLSRADEALALERGMAISAPQECPFYSARRIDEVKVGPSPVWLRAKIESVGIRSINNIVDISNFVLLELGQPTHAFDAAKLRGEINVRLAREGEKFLALDGKTYSLKPDNLVIADAERAVGIGGVMGGEETGVGESTTTVLLESAYFSPASIRRTARSLNLPSDASYRFERGVDPQMILRASQRATELICEIAGGKAADEIKVGGELPPDPPDVALRYERLDALLGTHVEPSMGDAILTRFGLEKNQSRWKIPSFRRDLQREVDLIEEVVRAYGIEKISSADRSRFTPLSEADRDYDFEADLRNKLVALGLNEARTSALIARSELARAEGAMELRNPLSEDHVALRTSLVPGLLGALTRNLRAGAERIALFEIGNVFAARSGEQKRVLGIVMKGQLASEKSWRAEKNRTFDFFDLKGVIGALRSGRDSDGSYDFRRVERPSFLLAAEVLAGERTLGLCGQLADASAFNGVGPVLVAELDVAEIARTRRSGATFMELELYPAIRRDIAMFVGPSITHQEIMRVIAAAKEPLLERVELFDLFSEKEGDEAASARKSLAYSLTYRDKSRTLTHEEVNAAHTRMRERLRNEIGAQLRE